MKSNSIYDYVERLSELLRIDSRQVLAEHGLQPVQLEMLHYLSICNQYSNTPKAVTEYLGQTKGTVSQTLIVLEKKALLAKYPDKKDKRVSHLKVTEKGMQLLKQSIPTPMIVKACEQLTDKQQLLIDSALNQLLFTILQANGMKSFGVCRTCRFNIRTESEGYFCNLLQQALAIDDIQLICVEHENKLLVEVF